MNAIINFLVEYALSGMTDFVATIQKMGGYMLDFELITSFTDFFQDIGKGLAAIAVVIALFTAVQAQSEGQQIKWGTIAKNIALVSVIALAGNSIIRLVYKETLEVVSLVLKAISVEGEATDVGKNLFPGNDSFVAIMSIFYAYNIISIFFQSLERMGHVVILQMTVHFFHFDIMNANYGSLKGWGIRFLVLVLSNVGQVGLMKIGLFTYHMLNHLPTVGMVTGIALIAVGRKAPQFIGEVFNSGLGAQGRGLGGMVTQSMMSISMLARAFG